MPFTRRSFGLSALGSLLLPAIPAQARAPLAGAQVPGTYRLRVGAFEVTVLSDGWLPIETALFAGDQPGARQRLENAFLAPDAVRTAVNEWLINTGDRLILVDTGTSNTLVPTLGRMARNLAAAGVDPADVDAVILTHLHPDHAAGLLTPAKQIAFPNATVHVDAVEHGFWTSDTLRAQAPADARPFFDIARASIAPYAQAGRLTLFRDGAEIFPGITAAMAPGHTMGHTMLRLASAGSELLIWGDIVHAAVLQCPEPERAIAFDTDQALAVATRRRVFDMAAQDRLLVAGAHLPFPGLGHVVRRAAGYDYLPALWREDL